APGIVEGAIDVRGRVVPVLDLRARFGLSAAELSPDEHMILARAGGRLVAIRADRATRVEWVDGERVEEPARITQRLRHFAGVAALPDGLILIHDLETFLSQAEAEALDEALAREEPR
ncbi:MAG TPA: chemotaxis protein CheW, partial [Brevibacterium sp.]|nr:chemotaxis protein CheW [Brevibacterium sp.]